MKVMLTNRNLTGVVFHLKEVSVIFHWKFLFGKVPCIRSQAFLCCLLESPVKIHDG